MWTSPQFALARLSDKFTTGSSIMPQKRNPDAAELVRAKTGRIAGAFQTLLIVMKGLPLAYAKDMQEDKEPLFDALDALKLAAAAMTGMVADLEPDVAAMKEAAALGHSTATDLADWLVLELGLPFRDAHHITGRIVALADAKGVELKGLTLADLQSVEPKITKQAFAALDVAGSVKSRKSYGGTAPANVQREAKRWIKRLEKTPLSRKKG
jgi:argininosuccinate lyase